MLYDNFDGYWTQENGVPIGFNVRNMDYSPMEVCEILDIDTGGDDPALAGFTFCFMGTSKIIGGAVSLIDAYKQVDNLHPIYRLMFDEQAPERYRVVFSIKGGDAWRLLGTANSKESGWSVYNQWRKYFNLKHTVQVPDGKGGYDILWSPSGKGITVYGQFAPLHPLHRTINLN